MSGRPDTITSDAPADRIFRLYAAFRRESEGLTPSALLIGYRDWDDLRANFDRNEGYLEAPHAAGEAWRVFGMNVLVQSKQPCGFPVCLDARGAVEAIDQGARPA